MLSDGSVKVYPKPPPNVFQIQHPYITPVDDEIIKVTAQFVARNGTKFLNGLLSRENRNPQYDFLKSDHFLNPYFLSLVDSYTKVLLLPVDEKEKLAILSQNRQAIIDRIMDKYMYEAQEARIKANKEKYELETKESVSRIDWFNFIIVETLAFPKDESVPLALPIDPRTGAKIHTGLPEPLAPETYYAEEHEAEEEEEEEEEEEIIMDEEGEIPQPIALPSNIDIRTDYVRERKSVISEAMIKSPVTGEMIKESDFSQHMRIVLLDPKWKEQSEKVMKRAREEGLAYTDEIAENISEFFSSRSHLYDSSNGIGSVSKTIGPTLPPGPPTKRAK